MYTIRTFHAISVMLDGKEVNEATRLFLQSWQANKELKKAKQKQRQNTTDTDFDMNDDRLPYLGLHHQSLANNPSATESSFPQAGPLTRQNKKIMSIVAKETEGKNGNALKAV